MENYGYKISIAGSGPEAIAQFSKNPAEIQPVISDLDMPFMDGRTTVAALRKIRPDIRVILASGSEYKTEGVLEQIKPDAFVSKPFTNETLLQIIYQVLAGKNNWRDSPKKLEVELDLPAFIVETVHHTQNDFYRRTNRRTS